MRKFELMDNADEEDLASTIFLVALAAVIAVNVIVALVAIATRIRRGLGGAWEP